MKYLLCAQESLLLEMWKELKFAVNWNAGDTKPIKQGRNSSRSTININITAVTILSRSRSRSMLSKSNAESLNKFGLIGEPDQKSAKSRKVPESLSSRRWYFFFTGFQLWLLWREFLWRKPEVGCGATFCFLCGKSWEGWEDLIISVMSVSTQSVWKVLFFLTPNKYKLKYVWQVSSLQIMIIWIHCSCEGQTVRQCQPKTKAHESSQSILTSVIGFGLSTSLDKPLVKCFLLANDN